MANKKDSFITDITDEDELNAIKKIAKYVKSR